MIVSSGTGMSARQPSNRNGNAILCVGYLMNEAATPATQDRRRHLRAGSLVAAIVLLPALGAWAWWASRPPYVRYESAPIGRTGHKATVLVPRGWATNRDYLFSGTDEVGGPYTIVL